jgi:anti-anti-sigma factor
MILRSGEELGMAASSRPDTAADRHRAPGRDAAQLQELMRFSVEAHALDGREWRVSVTGEADAANSPALAAALERALAAGARSITVDLTGATLVDSTALALFVGACGRIRQRDGRFRVSTDDPSVRKVFAITGLERMLT